MKRILSIQDLSCVGRCSLTVALPVLSAMGCQCVPMPTALLSSHTGFSAPYIHSLTEDISPICHHWQQLGVSFDAISVGYLSDPAQAEAVAQVLEAFPASRIIDPVLGDHGKLYSGISDAHVQAMKQLCSKAQVVLPNLTEAAHLTGLYDPDDYRALAAGMLELGAQAVVLTGVSTASDKLGFLAVSRDGSEFLYQADRIPRQLHGTGDLFAAVFAGAFVQGAAVPTAAVRAAHFVERVISATKEASPFGAEFETQLPYLWDQN